MDRALVTERLILRPLSLDDAAPTARLMTDGIARWTGSWKGRNTPGEVAERLARNLRLEARGDAVNWAVTLKATGGLIGWMGVRRLDAEPQRGSLGYWIGEAWFGQGYTREAVHALVPDAFAALDLKMIEAVAQVGNTASLAVLRGLGMRHRGQRQEFASARGTADLCEWYELDRPGRREAAPLK